MRVGIFGGTFDPVHYGHLLLAEACREACELEKVWFVPAAAPPHKPRLPRAAAEHRFEMLQLATGGHPNFEVSSWELDREGVSYTVDTLRQIREGHPDWELFLLLGADSLGDLPQWREPRAICELATVVAAGRPEWPAPDLERLRAVAGPEIRQPILVSMPLVGFSSSAIRQRVAAGRSIRYWLPAAVEQFIFAHQLYAG